MDICHSNSNRGTMKTRVFLFLAVYLLQALAFQTAAAASCTYPSCGSSCKAFHWNIGYCKDNECWCWKYGPSATRILKPLSALQCSEPETSDCEASECDQLCSPSKGHCGKGLCWCWRNSRRQTGTRFQKHLKQYKGDLPMCDYATCNQSCMASASDGGYCKGRQCWCWNHDSLAGQVRPLSRKWHLEQPSKYIVNPATLLFDKNLDTNDGIQILTKLDTKVAEEAL